jgi:hypothetical protein
MRKALTFILALMLMACSKSSDEVEKTPSQEEEKQPMLSFYVYAPEHPMLTRASVGDVNPIGEEAKVNSLQIWVFETANGKLVAYYEPQSADISKLNNDEGNVYQVPVTHEFADRRPRVDVFVLANVTTSNSTVVYGENSSRAELEAALLSNGHFGAGALTNQVPAAGLPMSGVLKNQPITGEKPVLRIGTDFSEMATVRLARAVSKLRFVFSALTGSDLKITGITIDAGLMTDEEYLFLNEPYNGRNCNIKSYLSSAVPFISATASSLAVKEVVEPLEYTFIDGMEDAQDYETRICAAINAGTLTSWGPFYLPESDKNLTGTITYTVGGSEPVTAKFEMADAGDFTRNHTWIVYAYYGDAVLQFNLVNVNSWTDKDVRNHDVYNW